MSRLRDNACATWLRRVCHWFETYPERSYAWGYRLGWRVSCRISARLFGYEPQVQEEDRQYFRKAK